MKTTILLLLLTLGCVTAFAQSGFIETAPVTIEAAYAATSPLAKYRYDSLSYENARSQQEYVYEKFTYRSDTFAVEGYACRPRVLGNEKVPVIIYNRGGTGNIGRLSAEDLPDFYWLAQHGFAVYASSYRFVGPLGAVDQAGGDDVNDVINLYEAVKTLDFVDTNNIFMMGVSRGGQMTYQSLRRIDLNAAAVLGGVADLGMQAAARPIFVTGWSDLEEEFNYRGLEHILPDFAENRERYFTERSATQWADEINTPVYILHSRQDGRVPVGGAIELVKQLAEFDKAFQVKIYDQKSHSLPYSRFDSFAEIVRWFESHLQ
jgi:dipeptidyl aminopeptidase/acylaminoacyl peptidase